MTYIIFILIKPFSDPSCPVDGGVVILEETTPISAVSTSARLCQRMERRNLLQRMSNHSKPSPVVLGISKLVACIIPSAQIAIGGLYLNACPEQHYIPVYLVVMGAFGLALALLSSLPCAQDPEDGPPNSLSYVCTTWNTLTSLFLFCWFISGNVWIYSIYQPNYNQTITNYNQTQPNSTQTVTEHLYCNKTLYLFAFWTNTLLYIVLGLLLVWGFCLMCCAFFDLQE
ncbi:hypothetical protein UPYG_G00239830 [Umbra pygmaea]|uniref:Uncharacterized protein n=1 Tax=Umbra pygmaea TaxID=75934 RepID=A0ABD0X2X1_UMBPY